MLNKKENKDSIKNAKQKQRKIRKKTEETNHFCFY
jgi:hypothetical protein